MMISFKRPFRILFAVGIFASLAQSLPLRADLLVKPGDVIAVSTDLRPQPKMISVDIEDYFLMCHPIQGAKVFETGQGLESHEYFMRRLTNDLAPLKPTIVLSSHGVQDGRFAADSRSVTYYEPTYLKMEIDALKKLGVRSIIIGSPIIADSTYLNDGADKSAAYNRNITAFSDADKAVADKEGVGFADITGTMLDVMPRAKAKYGDTYHFGANGGWEQYPVANGQLVAAAVFLKSLGCDGDIGAIDVDLTASTAKASAGQRIVSVQGGAVTVESTRYPFCFFGKPELAESTSGIASVCSFNDDLNRFMLTAMGIATKTARITWGTESRDVDAAALAHGINLAALFAAHTPFDAQFAKVDTAVWARQQNHSLYNDSYFHVVADLKAMSPTKAAAVDKLGDAILARDNELQLAAEALVVPVTHTIKIEALPDAK